MNPFQHGEVYVTEDGAETDLDLGHYERYTSVTLGQEHNFTSGRIYNNVITKGAPGRLFRRHRPGHPPHHRRNQAAIMAVAPSADVTIIEIGGTVGISRACPSWRPSASSRGPGKENVCYIT